MIDRLLYRNQARPACGVQITTEASCASTTYAAVQNSARLLRCAWNVLLRQISVPLASAQEIEACSQCVLSHMELASDNVVSHRHGFLLCSTYKLGGHYSWTSPNRFLALSAFMCRKTTTIRIWQDGASWRRTHVDACTYAA